MVDASLLKFLRSDSKARLRGEVPRASYEHSLALLDTWLGCSPTGHAFMDTNLRFVHINRALAELNGVSVEASIGRSIREVLPQLADTLEPALREVMRTGKPILNLEIHGETASAPGVMRDWIGSYFPVDMEGTIVGIGVAVTEITERKRLESSLRQLTEELKNSNQALEQFASFAAHELSEPLRMISLYLKFLEDRYKTKLDKDAEEFIAFAVDGAARMKSMVGGLLAFSRVGNENRKIELVDCSRLFQKLLRDLRLLIQEGGAEIELEPLPFVRGEELLLTQLFQNLLSNAIKFRGSAPPKIRVSCARRKDDWLFVVRDNGIGFDNMHAVAIFDLFRRLHNRDEYAGTGVGLAICKRIAQCHGGSIWAESAPGKGAAFYVSLPA